MIMTAVIGLIAVVPSVHEMKGPFPIMSTKHRSLPAAWSTSCEYWKPEIVDGETRTRTGKFASVSLLAS